jgi:Na+-driven multidrug efflux pump
MGVDGLAWATNIAQYLAMGLILMYLVRSDGAIRLVPRKMRIDGEKLRQIVKIGLPAGLQSVFFSISNVLIQAAINSFGSAMVAASSAASNIEGFVGTAMNAFYNAAITFVGQNMGARKFDRIDTVAKASTALIFATWVLLSGLTMLFARPLLAIYTTDAAIIELGVTRINVMMIAFFTCGIMNVFPGITRGMGFSVLPMICTLVGACLLRILWLWTFFAWYPTVLMLFACYPITWTLAGIGQVATFLYARRKVRSREQTASA